MTTRTRDTVEVGYDEFCGALMAKDLQPLWTQSKKLMPFYPKARTLPWLWKWRTVLPLAERAVELVPITRGGDRRVLALANPGLGGLPYTSTTLWGAIQYLGPRESAPAHRHSPSAIRFVLTGSGVWTTVDGDACDMRPGDLVLTPKWTWHDHTNDSDAPMAWFDGLDLPFVASLESIFFELYPEGMQPVVTRNRSEELYGSRALRPAGRTASSKRSPLLRYPYEETDRALRTLLASGDTKHATVEYADPLSGRPALPTLGCAMHRLLPGERTPSVRRAGSAIHVVFKGRGTSVIGGQRFEWETGDAFVVPSWIPADHEAHEPSDLFAVSDRPILETLDLYREETLASPQEVTSAFEPK